MARPKNERPEGPKPMVTAHEACHMAGVSIDTWRRWNRLGQCPAGRKIGPGTVRWSRAEIEKWLAESPTAGSAA